MGFLKWNLRYIRVVNSCVWDDFVKFLDDVLELEGVFTRRRYVWNLIRGKNFYKDITHYVTRTAEAVLNSDNKEDAEKQMMRLELIVHGVLTTEKSEKARQSFVWGLTKKVPLLTIDTIPYMSAERVKNILLGEKKVLNDSALEPFITATVELRNQVADLSTMNTTLTSLMGDG